MARQPADPRADRIHAAPSGASDISIYGAAPIALSAPAIAMTLGGAPAHAEAAPTASGGEGGGGEQAALVSLESEVTPDSGGSPFAAALLAPVMLADAAMAAVPKPQDVAAASEEPAVRAPDAAGGSGTPPGLLPQAPEARTEVADATPAAGGMNPPAMPAADAPQAMQSAQAATDAAMDAMGGRVQAMDDWLADVAARVPANDDESAIAGRVAEIEETADGIVASADASIAALTETANDTLAAIDLGPVGGADPAGGITTLVSMVSAADMFGLPDIGGGGDALTLPSIGGGSGDLLADFAPADVLLTVHDPHDGALGLLAGLTDDHSG